ncbi:diguanylate cyclase [Wenzhouxiangella sp. EGI_FJ10305]|uniref:diguanylate cyclase n=1 Tax=Wenzhouxiangella sp. EGI_FJ10305 TaxID=3243768 RepID=UPI0035D75C10
MKGEQTTEAAAVRKAARLSDLGLMPRRVYRLRMLGMGLAAPPVGAVLIESGAGWPSWVLLIFTALIWPQLALMLARRSREPYRTELRNLLIDSAMAGLWAPLMYFNLLPSVLLITLATVDKISTGIRGLWLWSLPGLFAGLVGGALVTGFRFQPESSMTVILACMPLLLIHTIAVSLTGYRLVRKVQRQNRQLDELSRIDMLTGLASRGHWQAQAELKLQSRHQEGEPVSLLLIDLDHFKTINDQRGHTAGDDALRGVSSIIRRHLARTDVAGRFGGDELAVVVEGDARRAEAVAEAIRSDVNELDLPHLGNEELTVSIGFAEAGDQDLGVREWLESADRALYRAKESGRNRIVGKGSTAEQAMSEPASEY